MYKTYLKQAWALIRQERLFSSVYIVGTGLAISLVMVLSIVFYVRIAPIYPDLNRDRLLVMQSGTVRTPGMRGVSSGQVSARLIRECLTGLPGVEAVATLYDDAVSAFVQPEGDPVQLPVMRMAVNDAYWQVFPFHFTEGKPFTEADFQSGLPVAVIARSLASRLYGEEEAVGRTLSLDFSPFRVVGVVDDASALIKNTYAQVWYPYTNSEYWEEEWAPGLGNMQAFLLVGDKARMDAVKAEAEDRLRRFSLSLGEGYEFSALGQPERHWVSTFREWSNIEPDLRKELLRYGTIFLLLLLVPAVSLSGMADSRMERRLAELGVRRAFGAPKGMLMGQILTENLLYTLLGGLLGLAFSLLLVEVSRTWVFSNGIGFIGALPEGLDVTLPLGAFFNPWVFVCALAVCFVLNLMSALLPAWRASRRAIVDSLNA